jgi:hypothetical protein
LGELEMNRTERTILWGFSLAGLLIPCVLFAAILIGHIKLGGERAWIMLVPWPTLPLLMSAEAGGGMTGEFVAFSISTAANVLIYGLIGGLASFIYRRVSARSK